MNINQHDLKIAELFLAGLPTQELSQEWLEGLKGYPFGGVHIGLWNVEGPAQLAGLVAEVQAAIAQRGVTDTPIIAVDHEGGSLTPFLRGEVTNLPGNMAVGAIGDPNVARTIGSLMGRELSALGITLNWAPVVDVNSNPKNPVIGVRAFGDSPELVGAMGAAMIEGLQSEGVGATAKHFPGHGDTEVDSHMGLPVTSCDLATLRAVHLPAFQAAVRAGVDAVMTAHILVPGLARALPATLNPEILDGLLRKELGYQGVIVTDALEMWGIQGTFDLAEAAVMAIEAGADIPLIVFDEQSRRRAFDAVRLALASGRISQERLELSVGRVRSLRRRIAARRALLGLTWGFDAERYQAMRIQHAQQVDQIAAQAVTLVVDPARRIPLANGASLLVVTPRQEALTPADTTGGQEVALAEALSALGYKVKSMVVSLEVTPDEEREVLAASRGAGTVIVGTVNAWRFPGQGNLLLRLAASGAPLVVAALRDPYDLELLPPGVTVLATCSTQLVSIKALALVLAGQAKALGRIPVHVV